MKHTLMLMGITPIHFYLIRVSWYFCIAKGGRFAGGRGFKIRKRKGRETYDPGGEDRGSVIQELQPNATVMEDGFLTTHSQVEGVQSADVQAWLDRLALN